MTPARGATGVSPAIGQISVAYGNAAVVQFGVTLAPSDGSASLHAAPPLSGVFPSSGIVTIPIPVLKSGVTYTVTGQSIDLAHVACFTQVTGNFGSFTTQ
ncbi:MAG TPA: hypothetical protein VGC96_12020 [Candidatus Elarobacter sp.]|jgi:hypothetical protein